MVETQIRSRPSARARTVSACCEIDSECEKVSTVKIIGSCLQSLVERASLTPELNSSLAFVRVMLGIKSPLWDEFFHCAERCSHELCSLAEELEK